MRLNRYLSQCGLGSRRGCEQLVLEGRVSINGHVIRDLATQVNPDDRVVADGKPVKTETGVVIALHKPRGYICSRSDEKDRMTIYSLLPKQYQMLHHVGRLDKDSEGLLLMTNRGELSHRLIHPSMGAEKEYEVIVDQPMDQVTMAKLVKGMLTEEGYAKCERAWMITEYRAHVVLKQGLKRQIRLMFYQLGFEVERLTRTRIGWLELKNLQKGGWKQLTETEVERFFSKEGATGRAPRVPKAGRSSAKETADTSAEEDDDFKPRRSPTRGRAARTDRGDDAPRSSRRSPAGLTGGRPSARSRSSGVSKDSPRSSPARGRSRGTRDGDESPRPSRRVTGSRSEGSARSSSRQDESFSPRRGPSRRDDDRPARSRSRDDSAPSRRTAGRGDDERPRSGTRARLGREDKGGRSSDRSKGNRQSRPPRATDAGRPGKKSPRKRS